VRAAAAVVLVVPTAAIIIILGASRHRQHHDSREQPREEAGRGDALANATAAATAGHNGWCDLFAGLPVLPWRLRYSRGMVYLTAGGGEGPVSSVSSGSSGSSVQSYCILGPGSGCMGMLLLRGGEG
jgi:hypothetical protein